MELPPSLAGAVQLTRAERCRALPDTPVGAPGTPDLAADDGAAVGAGVVGVGAGVGAGVVGVGAGVGVGAPSGGASTNGDTGAEGADAGPNPTAFLAATVKV
jgi:hypothetical protein